MKQLVMGSHRSEHWKPEEDMRLIELIEAGKSWVLISAILKRSVKTLQDRSRLLRRRADLTTGGPLSQLIWLDAVQHSWANERSTRNP